MLVDKKVHLGLESGVVKLIREDTKEERKAVS